MLSFTPKLDKRKTTKRAATEMTHSQELPDGAERRKRHCVHQPSAIPKRLREEEDCLEAEHVTKLCKRAPKKDRALLKRKAEEAIDTPEVKALEGHSKQRKIRQMPYEAKPKPAPKKVLKRKREAEEEIHDSELNDIKRLFSAQQYLQDLMERLYKLDKISKEYAVNRKVVRAIKELLTVDVLDTIDFNQTVNDASILWWLGFAGVHQCNQCKKLFDSLAARNSSYLSSAPKHPSYQALSVNFIYRYKDLGKLFTPKYAQDLIRTLYARKPVRLIRLPLGQLRESYLNSRTQLNSRGVSKGAVDTISNPLIFSQRNTCVDEQPNEVNELLDSFMKFVI